MVEPQIQETQCGFLAVEHWKGHYGPWRGIRVCPTSPCEFRGLWEGVSSGKLGAHCYLPFSPDSARWFELQAARLACSKSHCRVQGRSWTLPGLLVAMILFNFHGQNLSVQSQGRGRVCRWWGPVGVIVLSNSHRSSCSQVCGYKKSKWLSTGWLEFPLELGWEL